MMHCSWGLRIPPLNRKQVHGSEAKAAFLIGESADDGAGKLVASLSNTIPACNHRGLTDRLVMQRRNRFGL